MWAYCNFCGKGFDSHDGGKVEGNFTFCPDCEELHQNGMLPDAPPMDVYEVSSQPETCRKCGARTHFVKDGKRQIHTCQYCGYRYITEVATHV